MGDQDRQHRKAAKCKFCHGWGEHFEVDVAVVLQLLPRLGCGQEGSSSQGAENREVTAIESLLACMYKGAASLRRALIDLCLSIASHMKAGKTHSRSQTGSPGQHDVASLYLAV